MKKNNNIISVNSVLLKNGTIYDPFIKINKVADILIKRGKISEIKREIKSVDSKTLIVDCKNKIITNGFIDLHSHFREPGFEIKETIQTGSLAAFYGGYTRVCTMANTSPVIDTPELVKHIINQSDPLPVYIHPIGAITKGQKGEELAEIGGMVKSGAVAISDDGIPLRNSYLLRMALEYSKKFNIPVINHAEDVYLVNEGLMNEGINALKLGLPGNPDIAESSMIFRDLSISHYVGGRIHIPHVSCYKSLEVINQFKKIGLNITAEVTPHHLSLTDNILVGFDTNAKVAPPIRTKKDRDALIKGVQEGIIDCVATDHAPHSIEDKERDFQNACCGMIGLESAFGLVNKTLSGKMDLKSIINLFTVNPAKVINITPNLIKVDNLAELTIIDPNCEWVFNEEHIFSKSKNTPIIGKKLKGRVVSTINKGFLSNYNNL